MADQPKKPSLWQRIKKWLGTMTAGGHIHK
jgi:hypothetical protein